MTNYRKTPLDIHTQISRLKSRKLSFDNEARAAATLHNISYYRLRAYTYPFQDNSNPNHPFMKEVSFDEIISIYDFDSKLRFLVFRALEKIEIALRTRIVYYWALIHGSHWYENPALYRVSNRFIRDLNKLYEEVDRSNETFIKHYKKKYNSPPNPAAWMSLEVASLGLLSKLFENLKKGEEKKSVAKSFGLSKPEILESWMHTFAQIRNICAHHGRLWNRRLTVQPVIPRNTDFPFIADKNIYPNKLYASLCCIAYMLNVIDQGNRFAYELKEILSSTRLIDANEMGFPPGWENEQIWKNNTP